MDVNGLCFQDVALWCDIIIAGGHWIAACISVLISTPPVLARNTRRVELHYIPCRTVISVALARFATALVEVCVGTIPVVAFDVMRIYSKLEAAGAFHESAAAFLDAASVPVPHQVTHDVLTVDVYCVEDQHVSCGWLVGVTPCLSDTAIIPVYITAHPAHAVRLMPLLPLILVDEAMGARVSRAPPLLRTAQIITGLSTVRIGAVDLCRVVLQEVLWRTNEASAFALFYATRLVIKFRACAICAKDFWC
jgi:hypothetical protein